MAVCDKCGASFNKSKVRSSTDDYWGSGKYEWVEDRFGTFCADCIDYYLYMEDDSGNAVEPENIGYPD